MIGNDEAGISVIERTITFNHSALEGWAWPVIEITAPLAGPHLCIMAGMHPNEVSSMEAAIRLREVFENSLQMGRVSIMPVVNLPGLYLHSEFVCPIDNKNINFCFPGDPDGTFSNVLAHALLNEWSQGADVLVDLHGGDMREMVADFTMIQLTGNADHDGKLYSLAQCFDADLRVSFAAGQTENTGRATNQSKPSGTLFIMTESGGNGNLTESAVSFHANGCENIAIEMGMIEKPRKEHKKTAAEIDQFSRIECPGSGRFYPNAEPAQKVTKDQEIGLLRDIWGKITHRINSPIDGHIVFRVTHNIVSEGDWVFAIGRLKSR